MSLTVITSYSIHYTKLYDDGVDDQKEVMRYLEIPEHYTYSVNHERPRIDYQNELV